MEDFLYAQSKGLTILLIPSVPGVAGLRSHGIFHSVGTSDRIFVTEYEDPSSSRDLGKPNFRPKNDDDLKIREKNIEMKRNKSRDSTQQ